MVHIWLFYGGQDQQFDLDVPSKKDPWFTTFRSLSLSPSFSMYKYIYKYIYLPLYTQ